ncbi:PKD domain-containing protein [Porifericola rhodea]|uniref:PKD-like domain-containing protein n=1 Tax=Porifericola rhodea TaxID=930972 RepID=UPI0026650D8C|nr:PKD-like domain-containing protein [Porifericola rhodea]WKN29559.1 PKD domain-containing protein [Porifericola rhodea]
MKNLSTLLIWLLLQLAVFEANAQICYNSGKGNAMPRDQSKLCAPSEVYWNVWYFGLNDSRTNEVVIDWGDGSPLEVVALVCSNPSALPSFRKYEATVPHTYPKDDGECIYEASAFLRVDGTDCDEDANTIEVNVDVWDTDNVLGNGLETDEEYYEICAGNTTTVNFTDITTFTCLAPDHPYNVGRWIQWEYGTNSTITGDVKINGVNRSFPYSQTPVHIDKAATSSGVQSLNITVPETTKTGEVFELTLNNWNSCNPYEDASGNPTGNAPVSKTVYIRIVDAPQADFSFDNNPACVNNSVQFTNLSSAGMQYAWDFGDGTTSTAANPTKTYSSTGKYTVSLTVTDGGITGNTGNCITTITKEIDILPQPVADFSFTPAAAQCENTSISFTNNSLNVPAGTNWNWEIRKNNASGQRVNVNGNNIGGYASTAKDITASLPYFGSGATAKYVVRLVANTPNACTNTSAWQTVEVKANVGTPNFSAPVLSRCQGNGSTQYTASANYADSYLWELSPASAGSIDNSGLVSWNSAFTGMATVKVTAQGCGTDKSKSINVNVTPVVGNPSAIAGDTEVCQGTTSGTYTTSAANATNYIWTVSGAGNTISGSSTTATVNWAPGFTGTATIEVVAEGCNSTSTPYSITVDVKPTPQLDNAASYYNLTICSNETAEFIPSAVLSGSLFKWTTTVTGPISGMTSNASGQTIGSDKISDVLVNSGTVPGTVTYHITPYKDGCEGTTKDFSVIISPGKPDNAGAIAGTNEFCEKESAINFNVPDIKNADDYIWNLPAGASITSGSNSRSITVDFSGTAAGAHNISVFGRNSCGDGGSSSFSINIKPQPVLTLTVSDNDICHNEDAVIGLGSNITGSTFNVRVISKDGNIAGANDENNISGTEFRQQLANNGSTPQNVTFRVSPVSNGCEGDYQDVTFTVNPSPDVTINAAATTICDGEQTDISLSGAVSGTSFNWTTVVSDASLTGATNGSGNKIEHTLSNTSNVAQTIKYIVVPSANGCDGPSQEITITVQPTPVLSTIVAANAICSGEETDISLSSNVSGTTFSWVVSKTHPSLTATDNSGTAIKQTINNSSDSPQKVTYTITPYFNGCAGASEDVEITVNPRPELTINAASAEICNTETTDISLLSNVSGTIFNWTVSMSDPSLSGATPGSGDQILQTLTNTSNVVQTVTYHITTEANSCSGESKDFSIDVKPTPQLSLTAANSEICSGDNANISFTSSVASTSYSWTVVVSDPAKISGAASGSGNSISQTLTNSGTSQEEVTYRVTPIANGCTGTTEEITIKVNPQISTADAGPDNAICGLNYNLNAATPSVGTGKWVKESGPGTVVFADDTDPNTAITVSSFGNYAFRWTLTNGSCGSSVDFVSLAFKDAPATSSITGKTEVCVNTQNVLYQVDAHSGSTYNWVITPALNAPSIKYGGGSSDNLISLDFGSNEWIGELSVTETNNGCTAATQKISISSYQLPVADAGADQTICEGSSIMLGGAPSASGGSGNYTYLWTPASGLDDATLANPTATITYTRTYSLKVTDSSTGCESVVDNVTITVEPQLQAGSIGGTQTICEGTLPSAFTQNPATNGNGSYTYQWQKSVDGGTTYTDIPGANAALYEETNALSTTTWYRRKVNSGVCGEQITTPIEVVVEPELKAGTIGTDQTIVAGATPAKLSSITDGDGITGFQYQWQKATGTGTNFSDIAGATTAEFQPAALSTTTFFRRVVSGGVCAPVTSNVVKVTVEASAAAGTIEDNQVICTNSIPAPLVEKDPASGGTGTYQYRWSYSVDGINFTIIPSENGTGYTPSAPLSVTTYYKREMQSGVAPWVSSNVITVTVEEEIDPGVVAGDQTICQGGNPIAFTETTAPQGGSGSYQYQWKSSNNASGPFADISGAINATYDVPAGLNSTTYYVREVRGGECVPRLSNVIEVIVEPTLVGGTIAGSQTVCYQGDPVAFSSSMTPSGGNGTFAYQWQEKIGSGVFVDIAGATAETYDVPPGIEYTTTYRRKVSSGSCASTFSNEITVNVQPTLYPGSIAGAQTVCENADPAEITSIASPSGGAGSGTYLFQWKSSDKASGPFTAIPGAVYASYDPPAGISDTTYFVREVTSGSCGPVQSNVIVIKVEPTLTAGSIVGSDTICQGSVPPMFGSTTAADGGNGAYSYQWQWSYTPGGPYTDVPGATSATYQVANPMNTTTYFVRKVSGGVCGEKYSNEILVKVEPTINPGSIGGDQTICAGSTPTAFVQNPASGGNNAYNYQWQSASNELGPFSDISGATSATYQVSNPMSVTTFFRRKVSAGVCDEKFSNTIKVTVEPTLTPGSISVDQTIPANTAPLMFNEDSSAGGGTGSYTYQWKYATNMAGPYNIIFGANSATYQAGNLSQTTYFVREVSSGVCPPVVSNVITVTVEPSSAAGMIGSSQIICAGSVPAPLTELSPASGGTGSYNYQWQMSTDQNTGYVNIAGANDKDYSPTQVLTTTTYYRREVKSGVSPAVYTSPVQITVQDTLVAGVIEQDQTICENGDPNIFLETTPASGGSGMYSYQWKSSTTAGGPYTDIPLATNRLYDVPAGLTQTTYYVREVSSGVCGAKLSNEIKVSVEPTLTAGKVSGNQTICEGSVPTAFTESDAADGGTGMYSYQWKYATNAGGPYLDIAGAKQKDYAVPAGLTQTTYYVREVSSGVCAVQLSNEITVIVEPTLQAGQIAGNDRICEASVTNPFTSTTSPSGGNGVYTFQWKSSTTSGGPYQDIVGATGATYNAPDTLTKSRYFVREVISGVCQNKLSNEVYIIVDPTLDGGSISGDQSIVMGGDPTAFIETGAVSGGSGSYTFQWQYSTDSISFNDIAGATTNEYDVPSGLLQTTYYRRRVEAGVCGMAYSNIVKVTVESTLEPGTVGNDQLICEGDIPATLVEISPATGGNNTYTYQWKSASQAAGPYTNIPGATDEFLSFSSGLTDTTYFIREVYSGVYAPVVNAQPIVITVQPTLLPGSIRQSGIAEICFGEQAGRIDEDSAPQGGDGNYTYQWMSSLQSGGPYQDIAGANSPDYQPPQGLEATTYYVRKVSSGKCASITSNEIEVIVNPLPEVSLTSSVPNHTICDGTEVSFTASGADLYEFYLNGIAVQGPSPANTFVSSTLVDSDTVYVLGTDINGCQSLSNSIVTKVNELPTATIEGTVDICDGNKTSLILNMTGKMPFEVVYTDGIQQYTLKNLAYESILNVQPSQTTNYMLVSVTDANGCTQNITDQEAVVKVGHAVAEFSVVGDNAACSPHTLQFKNENILEGVTYTWVWGDGTEDVVTTAADSAVIEHTFVNYTSSRDMTYQVTLIATHDEIGCTDRATNSVHVYPTPEIRVEHDKEEGCGPLLVHFTNNSFGAQSHRWYYRVKGTQEVLEERSSKSVSYILPNLTTETLTYEVVYEASTDRCQAEPEIFEIVVHPELKPYFSVTPTHQNLPNSTISIENMTNEGDWDYFWDFGDGTSSTEKDPGEHTYETHGQYYVTLTVSKNGCSQEYEEYVVIDIDPDLPFVEFEADFHAGCGPLTVTFTNESNYVDPSTFQWDFGDGTGTSSAEHPVHTYTQPGKYSVKLEATNIFGEHKLIMKEFLVEVYQSPQAIFSAGPPTVYLPDRPITTINQSIGATAYEWHFGDGTVSTEFEPSHIYTEAGEYDIMLIAFSEQGCSDTLLIERVVSVKEPEAGKTRIPNSFTPDPRGPSGGQYQYGDLSNDIFIPIIDGITEMSMTIYNRWGKVIFSGKDKFSGWDGYYQGELCPADVYYYKIDMKFINGERKTEYGDVTLIR